MDRLAARFLSVPLAAKDREAFVDYARNKPLTSEPALRELLYLVLSAPEYQVN